MTSSCSRRDPESPHLTEPRSGVLQLHKSVFSRRSSSSLLTGRHSRACHPSTGSAELRSDQCPRQTQKGRGALGSGHRAVLPVVMSSSISSSMSWVSSISLVLCTTSFLRHRYPFSTVPTKRLLKCLLMDSTSTKEERRPVGTGKSCCKSSG